MEQFLRQIASKDGESPDLTIRKLERTLLKEINSLGIGPMGLGGNTTVLDVKIAARSRLPASFFVTVAYMCWALRRRTIIFGGKDDEQ
jgi:fumarate hydratase class I